MAELREWVKYLIAYFKMSERKACETVGISRPSYHYQRKKKADSEIQAALHELAEQHHSWGFSKMAAKLKTQGKPWNHKRIYRIYCEMKLNLRVKPKKRIPSREKIVLQQPERVNETWSIDFMSDALTNGRAIRTFNIMDDYNREALWIDVKYSFPADQMTKILDRVAEWRGYPKQIRSDNGPEFLARHTEKWAKEHKVQWLFIQPGKPNQNGYVERMNRTFREDVLDAYLLNSISQTQELAEEWLTMYNYQRPHEALHNLTPIAFAKAGNH